MLKRSLLMGVVAMTAMGVFSGRVSSATAAEKDIVTTAVEAGTFQTLAAALKAAGLVETLQGQGPFTVFAPTDEAFAKLPAGTVENLLKPENKEKLVAILKFHVVPGRVLAKDVLGMKELKTVHGGTLTAAMTNGAAKIQGAGLVATDIDTSNGVIHVIDSVLLPPAATEKTSHATRAQPTYAAHACPSSGRVTYTLVQPARCR